MAEIDERLTPKDGLNNYNVVLARLDLPTHGGAQFTFAVTNSMLPVAEFQVGVPAAGQSMDRMMVEAHDALIDILRQLMFRAEKARVAHDRNARPVLALTSRPSVSPEDEFAVTKRTRPSHGLLDADMAN
jgi:hypothetical protein